MLLTTLAVLSSVSSVFSATTYDFCGDTGINSLFPGAIDLLTS